ncbi:MAG: SbcC/MukB-like Walker B domain-containing protein [Methylococcales bacterium]|nr:SbcC/MukB-like Walker B domain-containing protein [Methylococcales bacterium]
MRILNIHFKNINSLEGEGRVSFDQGPIADSGVFAITGPNGSGKTSILDVITLGLYGETFRFDKPAQHIITKHANDSFAVVEFAFDGEKYRSAWQVRRDQAAMPDMTLTRLNGGNEVLAETPYQVRNYIAELTGMDFHKFSKAIVLPQGDFAAFLNALDSERLDILEKISGTALYDQYRRQAETEHHRLQAKIADLLREIELIPLLDDESLEAAEHDLHDHSERREELRALQNQVQQKIQSLQDIATLEARHGRLSSEQQQLLTDIDSHQAELQRIAAMPQAALMQADVQMLDNMQAAAGQSRQTLQNFRSELEMLQRQLAAEGLNADSGLPAGKSLAEQKQLTDSLKLKVSEAKLELPRLNELVKTISEQLAVKKQSLQETEIWLQANRQDAALLTAFPEVVQLRNLRAELTELAGRQKTQGVWTKKSTLEQKKNTAALTAAQTRLAELKTLIETSQNTLLDISDGKNLDALKELQNDQANRLKDFEHLFSLAGVHAKLSQRKSVFSWFGGNKQVVVVEEDETELQQQLESLKLELAKEENIGRALEQAIETEQLLKKLAEQRDKLVDGKPCALCGATEHPYALKPPLPTDSKKALADQRTRSQMLRARVNDAEKQLLAAQKRSSQLTAKQKFLQQKRNEWIALANRLNIARDGLEIDNISMQEKILVSEADELEKIRKLVEDYQQLQRTIDKAKTEIVEKQALLDNLRLTDAQLKETRAEHSPEFEELEQQFKQRMADKKALLARLEPQLKLLGEKLPAKGKENAAFDRLNTRRQDYQIRDLRQKGLHAEIDDLLQKQQVAQSAIVRIQQDLNTNLEALRQEELLSLQLATLDKQKLIMAQEQAAHEQELSLEGFKHALAEKITAQGFSSPDELYALLNLMAQQPEIETLLAEQMARSDALDSELLALDSRLQTEINALGETSFNLADLQAIEKHQAAQLDITEQEIRSLENKLEKQAQYRQKYQELDNEMLENQHLFADSEAEIQLISDDPTGFRRKILQLQIDRLLSKTNQILEKISGRYYVRQAENPQGLALEIEDTRQQNVRRLPKTLSGGEIFVVSLALALALAEIANNGKAIESLFLDEGFGNLDAEALYLAIGALEGLKTQGRTVGVISHVEGVKKRIKTQIELIKKPNGLSELKMVA